MSPSYAERKPTRRVEVGSVPIGGGAPVSVQSMTSTDTRDVQSTVAQIMSLEAAGVDLVRVAVVDMEAGRALKDICRRSSVPIIADIHFDHRLALAAIEAGVDKIRINPGNLPQKHVGDVLAAAEGAGIPIRIGVNSGSLPSKVQKTRKPTPRAMVDAALEHLEIVERIGFSDVVISLKASSVPLTVQANEMMSEMCNYPLHLGITEAGPEWPGSIKSAAGLGYLLGRGIGDTIRVSLTDDPVKEVQVGKEILSAWGLRSGGIEVVSCPTCGRCRVDLVSIVHQVQRRIDALEEPDREVTVAVMGCEVNGPGEARAADVGLACGEGVGLLLRDGEVVRKVAEPVMVDELLALLEEYLEDLKH